jgi:hypothetical protein
MGPSLDSALSDRVFTRWCNVIFEQNFEVVSSLSLGRYGCPFV